VIETRATIAIVRRHIDRSFARDFAMQFALVGGIAYVFAPQYANVAPFAIAALAATTSLDATHVRSLRRLTFFTVPLYGRQLARAHAIAPSVLALSLPFGYVAGSAVRGAAPDLERILGLVFVTLVTTLVALSSTFRDGRDRGLYAALAFAAGSSIALTEALGPPWFAATVLLAGAQGFAALRAFGETLARYDPLPEP